MGNTSSAAETSRERLLSKHGVLIPPSFGTGLDTVPPPSLSPNEFSRNNIPAQYPSSVAHSILTARSIGSCHGDLNQSASAIRYLFTLGGTPGLRLLSPEHLHPGLWVSSSTPSLDGNITACLVPSSSSGGGGDGRLIGGFVTGAKLVNMDEKTMCGMGVTAATYPPFQSFVKNGTAFVSRVVFNGAVASGFMSAAESESDGGGFARNGRIGWNYATGFGSGSDSSSPIGVAMGSSASAAESSGGLYEFHGLSSYVTVQALSHGFAGALELDLPLPLKPINFRSQNYLNSKLSYFISFDLNRFNDSDTDMYDTGDSGPPLLFTLHKFAKGAGTSEEMAATVSQTLTFDRTVLNPIEERCPKIRNTVTWSVQMCRRGLTHLPDKDITAAKMTTSLNAALAWQLNRGLCYRFKLDETDGLTFAVLMKRWAHPRLTSSFIFAPFAAEGKSRLFKGVGLQFEAGPLPGETNTSAKPPKGAVRLEDLLSSQGVDRLYGAAADGTHPMEKPPETKATLP